MDVQRIIDAVFNAIKLTEDLDPSAVLLEDFKRSIQLDSGSCGVHAVSVILRYFGKHVSLEKLREELNTDCDGTGTEDIKRVLKKYGLKFKVDTRGSLKAIKKAIDAGSPVLISTYEGDHWAVVYGYSVRAVYVSNSSVLKNWRCRVPVAAFKAQWDGWMISVHE